jgi:hypothetical protein
MATSGVLGRATASQRVKSNEAACEGQSISSRQGNADDDQTEYGPSDLSTQSDASTAAVAALVALLDGGPDAVTPKV